MESMTGMKGPAGTSAAGKKKAGRPRSEHSAVTRAKLERFAGGKAAGLTDAEAVRRAGYEQTEGAAKVTAKRLKARPDVQLMIAGRLDALRIHAEVGEAELVGTLAAHLRGVDLSALYPDDPFVARLRAAGADNSSLVPEIRRDARTGQVTVVKFADSQKAAVALARHTHIIRTPDEEEQRQRRERARRKYAEDELTEIMKDLGVTREEALRIVREHAPTLSKWLA